MVVVLYLYIPYDTEYIRMLEICIMIEGYVASSRHRSLTFD